MSIESFHVRAPAAGANGQEWELAATVFLPPSLSSGGRADVLVLMPGAGYSRGYFDLDLDGFSQARHHAAQGLLVITLDYLGTGESSVPTDATWLDGVAAIHNSVTYLVAELAAGRLVADLGPIDVGRLVAAGQSLGGHLAVATQAVHQTFGAIATLGASTAGTVFPTREHGPVTDMAQVDFAYAFHWIQPSEIDPSTVPTDLESLVSVDVAIGCPMRTAPAPWASQSVPAYVLEMLADDTPAISAGKITVPVLLAAGERDVTRSADEEAATFPNSVDLATFTLAEAAHMHNFAATRRLLWERLDEFVGTAA